MKICEIHYTIYENGVVMLLVQPGVRITNYFNPTETKNKDKPGAPSGGRSVTTSPTHIQRSLRTCRGVGDL